jgi:hypothetical protein
VTLQHRYSTVVVEFQAPSFVQNSPPDSPVPVDVFQFSTSHDYARSDVHNIPSIKSVSFSPGTASLGENLGQRTTVTVTFSDHKHIMAGEDFDSGTFWGKFRARYGLKLRGRALSVATFTYGDDNSVQSLESRGYFIDSVDGPNANGEYKIIAKDILKFADGDRAQAPVLSNGFLVTGIAAGSPTSTTATLSPAGIGNAEYPASGYVAIGGKEICSFTRVGDVLELVRGQFNTEIVEHDAQDRVQLCLQYSAMDVADIIHDLLTTYAGVSTSFITLSEWQTETTSYIGTLYTALIAEPTSVNTLVSELIEQAALVVWWDDLNLKIRMQVLRQISTAAYTFDDGSILANSLEVNEQPEKRISHIYTYFGKISPLVKEDQVNNYRSTALTFDADAEAEYGSQAIKKIYSRWIPSGGRSIAERLNDIQLGRFRDPPRRIKFETFRYSGETNPYLGGGFKIEAWLFQNTDGTAAQLPIQVTRVNPMEDRFVVEAEEMLFTAFGGDIDPTDRTLIFDANENDINLRSRHDEIYTTPQSGDIVTIYINNGVIIGSTSIATPAVDVGTWPAGVTLNMFVIGRIEGKGGNGGAAGIFAGGQNGGTALYARFAITVTVTDGEIFGGGGGGAPGENSGGGGGAGQLPGSGGVGPLPGSPGTTEVGGAGGALAASGGGPGVDGSDNGPLNGGTAGAAIDGVSFVTQVGTGDIRGVQIN